MMENQRKNGFYWVKALTMAPLMPQYPDCWIIGEWTGNAYGGFWELTGLATTFTDDNFDQIDETPIIKP